MNSYITKYNDHFNFRFTSTETLLSFNGTLGSSVGAIAAAAYEMMFTASDVENMGVTHIGNVPMDEYYLNRVSQH